MAKKPNEDQLYRYCWGNKKDSLGRHRLQYKDRVGKVVVWSGMNSCQIEFVDSGEQINCSRNALRKVK